MATAGSGNGEGGARGEQKRKLDDTQEEAPPEDEPAPLGQPREPGTHKTVTVLFRPWLEPFLR